MVVPSMFDNFTQFGIYDWFNHLIGIPFINNPLYYEPLWFLRDLIILNLLTFFLVPVVKHTKPIILILLMIIVQLLPIESHFRYSVAFFVIGMSLGKTKSVPIINVWFAIAMFLSMFVCVTLVKSTFVHQFAILIFTYSIISIAEYLVRFNRIAEMSKKLIPFSFAIYLTHQHPLTFIQKFFVSYFSFSENLAVLLYFMLPVVIIIVCWIFACFFKQLLPKTYNVFLGNR